MSDSPFTPPEATTTKTPEEYRVWCRLMKAASTTRVVPVRGIATPTEAQIETVSRYAWEVHDTAGAPGTLSYNAAKRVLNDVLGVPQTQ